MPDRSQNQRRLDEFRLTGQIALYKGTGFVDGVVDDPQTLDAIRPDHFDR